MQMTYELALPATVASVGEGRRLVDRALSGWNLEGLSYTATLLTSEVLTNSVLHARTPMVITISRTGTNAVQISVRDESAAIPRRRRHAQDATTGRGLDLLDRLAQSWGVESARNGKTLTFTVGGDLDPWAAYAGADWTDADL